MEVLLYSIIGISIWVVAWLLHIDIEHMDNVMVDIREELKKSNKQ